MARCGQQRWLTPAAGLDGALCYRGKMPGQRLDRLTRQPTPNGDAIVENQLF